MNIVFSENRGQLTFDLANESSLDEITFDKDILYVLKALENVSSESKEVNANKITELNNYFYKLGPKHTIIRNIRLSDAITPIINNEGKEVLIPQVTLLLSGKRVVTIFLIGNASEFSDLQLEKLGLTKSAIVSKGKMDGLLINDMGITWASPFAKASVFAQAKGLMPQTVDNPGRKPIDGRIMKKVRDILSENPPSFWQGKKSGWAGYLAAIFDGQPVRVHDTKFTFGINKIKFAFYKVPIPKEQGGIILEDGRTALAYPHLHLEENEIEIYVPEFLFDKNYAEQILSRFNVADMDSAVVLAQLIDRSIGKHLFGKSDSVLFVDEIRLNEHPFDRISEAALFSLGVTAAVGDIDWISRLNQLPLERREILPENVDAQFSRFLDEANSLWDSELIYPTTVLSEKIASVGKQIGQMEWAAERLDNVELIEQLFHEITSQIRKEFYGANIRPFLDAADSFIRNLLKSHGDKSKEYLEKAIFEWGRLRNEEMLLRSSDNLDSALRARAQKSYGFALFDLFGNYIDDYFARYIARFGIQSLHSISGGEYEEVRGLVRVVETFADAKNAGPHEIIVVSSMPKADLIAKVCGLISGNLGEGLTHESRVARDHRIPIIAIGNPLAMMKRLDGKWVSLSVMGKNVTFHVINPTEAEIEEIKREHRDRAVARVKLPIVKKLTKDNYIVDFSSMKSAKDVGNKAFRLKEIDEKLTIGDVEILNGDSVPHASFQRFIELPPDLSSFPELKGRESEFPSIKTLIEKTYKSIDPSDDRDRLNKLSMLQDVMRRTPYPKAMEEEIRVKMRSGVFKDGGPVAARSSSNCEDLENFSGAGFFESVSNLRTEDEILAGIKEVWASVYSDKAFDKFRSFNINPLDVSMSVFLQKQLQPDYSFVIDTANVKGEEGIDMNQVVITAAEGHGDALVGRDDKATVTRFEYSKKEGGYVVSILFGTRSFKVVVAAEGGLKPIVAEPLTEARFEERLNVAFPGITVKGFVKMIGRIATRIEAVIGKPLDLEMILLLRKEKPFVLVQARDIPNLGYLPVSEDLIKERYGKEIEVIFDNIETKIEYPAAAKDDWNIVAKVFADKMADMINSADPAISRFAGPFVEYIFDSRETGPQVLARCLWYSQQAHKNYSDVLNMMEPWKAARVLTYMCNDIDYDSLIAYIENEKKRAKDTSIPEQELGTTENYFKVRNAAFAARCIAEWPPEFGLETLKGMRPEAIALLVKEAYYYYGHHLPYYSHDPVKPEDENKFRTLIGKILDEFGERKKLRLIGELSEPAKEWLMKGIVFTDNGKTALSHVTTVVLSDSGKECQRIRKVFSENDLDSDDFIAENKSNRAAHRSRIQDKIQPSIIVLDMKSLDSIREFLVWLKKSRMDTKVILALNSDESLPESFKSEYNVADIVIRNASFDKNIVSSFMRLVKEKAEGTAATHTASGSRQSEVDRTEKTKGILDLQV